MADQNINCVDCGQSFLFSEKDQEFYKSMKYSSPKRCKSCRAKRKANQY